MTTTTTNYNHHYQQQCDNSSSSSKENENNTNSFNLLWRLTTAERPITGRAKPLMQTNKKWRKKKK
jgi:hypothetical protein